MTVFDPLNPLISEDILLSEDNIEKVESWFEENSKPQLQINNEEELTNAITVEQLEDFLALKIFHRRSYSYPSYGEIMSLVEKLNMQNTRMLTKDQLIYILNKFVVLPQLKHELKLAFKVFDTESRGYLELDELTAIVTSLGDVFETHELHEFLRDANVRGDGNVFYEDFVNNLFSVAPELYKLKTEYLYDDPDEDPSVPPLPPEPETIAAPIVEEPLPVPPAITSKKKDKKDNKKKGNKKKK